MTKVPRGFDFSFLNEEEARKILQVLERNEELQRAEKDRISKLQKTKRDIRWLQGVTGEWFEEIQRKKFCNETDVSQMLKPPLTYRLKKGMAENDPVGSQTSRSKNTPTPRNPAPAASRLSFRSSFASLFSFGKPRKDTSKAQCPGPKGCDRHAGPAVSVRGTAAQAKLYSSPLENQPAESVFVPKPAGMREGSGVPPWDASTLESEFFRVLEDLDSTLAQEQCPGWVNPRPPLNYGPRTQFSHFHSGANSHGNTTGRHKNHYNETSNMSIYDILRPGAPREGFKTFSSRIRTIYDMYRTREPRVLKEDCVQKNTFGSSSLCADSRRIASPATGHFTARSIHFPATTQNKSGFIPPSHQQSPKRTPLSSIIWNRSDSSGDRLTQEEFPRAPSPMEVDPADQVHPRCVQEHRTYEFYHAQSAYQSVGLNSCMDSAVSPDPFENSENMPFHHQDNPFARSFFSNTFGRSREQRFGRRSFWGQQGERSSWFGFHRSRKPFTSSDRDFEVVSAEANSASPRHGRNVPSQYWGSFSPNYRTTAPRDQEEPHPVQLDSQTSTVGSMGVSQGGETLMTRFGTPNGCPMIGSSYHIRSGRLECQQDSSPKEVPINQEPYSFGTAQTLASSFKTSFPRIPGDKRNHQRPDFQNPAVALQKRQPVSLPTRSCTEATVTNSSSVDSPPRTQSQPSILLAKVNNEKDLSESILEKDKQPNNMGQTNMTSEVTQPVSETGISNPLANFQSPLSQDSGKTNRFVFNASTTIVSERSPKVISGKDSSQIHLSQRDKANELKKDMGYTEKRKFGPAASFPFIQENRTPSSFPSPSQSCHQELIISTEDRSSIIENNLRSSEPTGNQNAQSPEKSAHFNTKEEQGTKTHSTKCSKSTAGHSIPCDSVGLPSATLPDSSPSNDFFLGALVVPSTTVFSRESLPGQDPSLGEGEQEDSHSQYPNNQLTLSPSKTEKSDDSCVQINNEVVDVNCHLHPPFRVGKGKAKVRRRTSYIEKLSKTESKSTPTSGSSGLDEADRSDSKAPERHTIYCTLPRKSASFLTNSRRSERTAPSFRSVPLLLQLENNLADPIGKDTSNKFNSSSSESESRCSKVISDSASVAPEATEDTTTVTNIGSASFSKGPFPFLTKRAASWPSGVPHASFGRDEGEEGLVSDMDASATTLRPWEKTINPLESDSPVWGCSLTKRYHQKGPFQERTEKDGKNAASKTFSLSNEDLLPSSSDMSGEKSGKTLRKFKTTSMFSVFGDEDNVKCLEVVSVYYTLPRKHSKKLCHFLQKHTQNTDALPGSTKVGTVTFSSALEREKLHYPTQEQSGTASSGHLASSAQENSSCCSPNTGKVTVQQLPSTSPSEPVLQERASVRADASLHKGESKTREVSPDHSAETPLRDSHSRTERGRNLQSETPCTSLIPQEGKAAEGKFEKCQCSLKAPGGGPSPPAHAEGIAESHQTRSSGERAGGGTATAAAGSPQGLPKAVTGTNSPNGLQPREVRGADFPQKADNALSDSESQVFALTPALPQLHPDEETCSGERDLHSSPSKPGELPQRSQKVNLTKKGKAKGEMQESAWDPPLLPEGSSKNKTSLEDLEKGKNRSSPKHRLAATSKASRKFPAKELSPRRHVATIFPQSGKSSGFTGLSLGSSERNPVSSETTPKSAGPTGEGGWDGDGMEVKKSENFPQVTAVSDREAATHGSSRKSNSFSQPHRNEFKVSSESPPKYENSKDVTVAPIWGGGSGTLSQPTCTSLGEADFSGHQGRLNPHLPVEPTEKSAVRTPLAPCEQQQRSPASLEWEPEPHPYRSKSLKSINTHGDLLRKSHPPKTRERHFSESTSLGNALSHLTLGDTLSHNNGYGRKFKSSSELPSCDDSENWASHCSRMKMGPRSATSISRPIDYGIFGKEQQLAFLENVKRSLTQGRLWKPSFLKNPGFLKDDAICLPNPAESSSPESPSNQMPGGGLSPHAPLNLYEEDPADSDSDTDTTTDDEYYLDELDKESEL